MLRLAVLLTGALLGCSDGSSSSCDESLTVGDLSLPLELAAVTQVAGTAVVVTEGGDIPIIKPPQGGKVILAGIRARNLVAGNVEIYGWLKDDATGMIYGLERRPARLVVGSDGWATPDQPDAISNYANISACPQAGLVRDVHDQTWTLEVRVIDCGGRMAETGVHVIPRCTEADVMTECQCECDEDYVLGQDCSMPAIPVGGVP